MKGTSGTLTIIARLAGQAAGLLALWTVWGVFLSVVGVVGYRHFFQFDAMEWENWADVRRQYLSGGTIAFDFAAMAVGLTTVATAGCLILALRSGRIGNFLFSRWPLAFPFIFLPMSLFNLFAAFRCKAPRHRRPSEGKSALDGSGMFKRPLHLVKWLRRLIVRPIRRVTRMASAETPAESSGEARMAEPTIGPVTGRPIVLQEPAALPLVEANRESPPTSPAGVAQLSPTLEIDGDYAAFGRAMALFEVWFDPAPDWLRDALREELDTLSVSGWALFSDFGEPAMSFLDLATLAGLLPTDPAKRSAIKAVIERRDAGKDVANSHGDEGSQSLLHPTEEDNGPPSSSVGPTQLTMGAAWLCEMVDNYLMLEEIRTAEPDDSVPCFDDRWGAIYQETGERLAHAMRAMTDQDWRSIDQFPDRAGRIRVLTDRFREALRNPTTRKEASSDGQGVGLCAPGTSMEDILRAAGFAVRTLPPLAGFPSEEVTDFLAQRGGVSVLLRLTDLRGGEWVLDKDSLAPWRAAAGSSLPSPCRAVWQRLALLRSAGRGAKPCAGVVVLKDGHFTDEQAVARIVELDRCRTDVGLAWLDKTSSTLPDLTAWLVRMEANQYRASAID